MLIDQSKNVPEVCKEFEISRQSVYGNLVVFKAAHSFRPIWWNATIAGQSPGTLCVKLFAPLKSPQFLDTYSPGRIVHKQAIQPTYTVAIHAESIYMNPINFRINRSIQGPVSRGREASNSSTFQQERHSICLRDVINFVPDHTCHRPSPTRSHPRPGRVCPVIYSVTSGPVNGSYPSPVPGCFLVSIEERHFSRVLNCLGAKADAFYPLVVFMQDRWPPFCTRNAFPISSSFFSFFT